MHERVSGLANQPFHRRIGMPARIGADHAPNTTPVWCPQRAVAKGSAGKV